MGVSSRFPALAFRDFRLFWCGQAISLSGTWMHSVAQSWLVYSLTHSPLYLGLIASLSSLPILLFTVFGGMVADRYPKRTILIITQFLSAVPAVFVAVLADLAIIKVWHVGAAALFLGIINAFDVPTRQSFLAEVVDRSAITNAIALNSAAFNGARILGPMIAGFVIAQVGIPACFYLNALSFIAMLFALFHIKARGVLPQEGKGLAQDMAAGWRFVVREPSVFPIMALIAVFSLFGIPYITLLPILADDVLGAGVTGLSMLVASAGAGSFVAAIAMALRGDIAGKKKFMPLSAIVFSVAITLIPFSENLHISTVLIWFAGWGVVSFLATANSFIQHAVPDALRGRVMSLYTLVFLGLAPIGNSMIGILAHAFGTLFSLKLTGIICIAASALLVYTFRRSHQEVRP
ncbi:MAG TPA: MFS transporter [Dissulfurispiraceae bacterium]|nr:MFS transporter [Dissulfurispiraceae bacterium]